MHMIMVNPKSSERDRAHAARVLADATEKETDFLERFGIKDIQTPVSETEITGLWGGKKKKEKKKK